MTTVPAPLPLAPAGNAPPVFQSFFMGGFECSTQRRPSGRRIDVIDATGHDRFAAQDYARLAAAGLRTARDGLRWHLIERVPGEYDFTSAQAQVTAARAAGVQVIWDLLHYGSPDFVDVFAPEFPEVFARFARAAAEFLRAETEGELWVCPVNEISFMAWGGGDVGYLNPFAHGRGDTLKRQLVRASIRAMDEVRATDPAARFLHAEPLISVQAHPERPEDHAHAQANHESQYAALDMLLGRLHPELGGGEAYVDVVGLNYYPYNQWHHHPEHHLREVLDMGHPAHRPLRGLLADVWARYGRPLLIAETGTEDAGRAPWFARVAAEALAARGAGVPVEGVCLYPVVNHPGWDDDRHCHNGLWDYPDALGGRAADPALAAALASAQRAEAGEPEPAAPPPEPAPAASTDPAREALTRLARAAPAIAAEAAARDRDGQFPAASFAALREAGLLTVTLSPEQGGLGLGGAGLLTLLRRVGRESLPVARLYEGHLNALLLVSRFGAPGQRARAVADARAGELFGVWNTEAAPGLHLEEAGAARWRLLGNKTFTSGAGHVTRPLLPAELPGGAGRAMVLLPASVPPERFDPDFWSPLGMRPTVSFRADLDGLEIGAGDLIGAPGDYYAQPEFGGGALRFLAAQLGGADAAMTAARDVLRGLGRQGDDAQRLRFAGVAAGLEAAWQVTLRAARLLDTAPTERALAYVALARTVTEDACLLAAEAAERAVGARGLLAPHPAERIVRDLRMYLRQPAPDAARLALGAWVLDGPEPSDLAADPWDPDGDAAC
ncbi:acyl-CoA dehydrogenase family protein [uncultured Deinococcus sp.]|uniref:acyl-CoA dehydrogenase family protein n=1 Tax=uncultured Deinococcus sp. TaxID=158789 RepID=UPI00258E9C22|nr:acyl-CoA dehydrogenase family protein [uncultured Deinococcus sp.]